MGTTKVSYTPAGEAGTSSWNLGTYPCLKSFQGHRATDTETSFSHGGKAYSVVHDSYWIYTARLEAINPLDVGITNAAQAAHAFWAHASTGGEFAFIMDDANMDETTLAVAESRGDTQIQVASITGLDDEEGYFLIDVNDPTKFELVRIESFTIGNRINLYGSLVYSYAAGSYFRHPEYFPACVALQNDPPLRQRPGGQGVNTWDFELTFRTVR